MTKRHAIRGFCVAAMAFTPVAAYAHPGIAGHVHGFGDGWAHPLSGIDHVLAMIAVGLFAAQLGGRALWRVPLTFVSVMALAGIAGMVGVALPFVEIGIGMSVVVLGLAVAFQLSMPTLVAASLVGFLAIFHGHAHGMEMAIGTSRLMYGLGFLSATALLHAIGVGLGMVAGKADRAHTRRMVQIGGMAMAVAGFAILLLP